MSDFFPGIAWSIPFLPLLGAGVAVLGPGACGPMRTFRWPRALPWRSWYRWACSSRPSPDKTITVMQWLTISNFNVPIEFRIDGLTTMMLSMVTFVSSLVAFTQAATWPATRATAGFSR